MDTLFVMMNKEKRKKGHSALTEKVYENIIGTIFVLVNILKYQAGKGRIPLKHGGPET